MLQAHPHCLCQTKATAALPHSESKAWPRWAHPLPRQLFGSSPWPLSLFAVEWNAPKLSLLSHRVARNEIDGRVARSTHTQTHTHEYDIHNISTSRYEDAQMCRPELSWVDWLPPLPACSPCFFPFSLQAGWVVGYRGPAAPHQAWACGWYPVRQGIALHFPSA